MSVVNTENKLYNNVESKGDIGGGNEQRGVQRNNGKLKQMTPEERENWFQTKKGRQLIKEMANFMQNNKE